MPAPVCLVTGVGSDTGTGTEIVRRFAVGGYQVAMLARGAKKLKELGLIDRIIDEPLGGAHRDFDETARRIKQTIIEELEQLCVRPVSHVVNQRQDKLRSLGKFRED